MKIVRFFALGVVLCFLISIGSFSVTATPMQTISPPVVGDTLIYEVTTSQIPDLLNAATGGNVTSSINLVGSQIGFKILDVNPSNYSWGAYIKAGAGPITITVKAGAIAEEASDFLGGFLSGTGDLPITIPAGAAAPIVPMAESNFNATDLEGIPLWLKSVNWPNVQSFASTDNRTEYTENADGTVTIKIIDETDSDGSQANISVTYAKTSETILKSLSFDAKVFIDDLPFDVKLVLSYKETKSAALPTGFAAGDQYIYKVTKSDLEASYTLNQAAKDFINAQLQSSPGTGPKNIDQAVSLLEALVK